VKLLLDTHVFLWWIVDDPRLNAEARRWIASSQNQVYVSAASTWEIRIKEGLGKLQFPIRCTEAFEQLGFLFLPIGLAECEGLKDLPTLHKDPFDRMLVSQSLSYQMTLLTADHKVLAYNTALLDVR